MEYLLTFIIGAAIVTVVLYVSISILDVLTMTGYEVEEAFGEGLYFIARVLILYMVGLLVRITFNF